MEGRALESVATEAKIISLRTRLSGCCGVLVDSNVLLDIFTNDPSWSEWSGGGLAESAEHITLIVNPIVYAQVSVGYATIEASMLPCQRDSKTKVLLSSGDEAELYAEGAFHGVHIVRR